MLEDYIAFFNASVLKHDLSKLLAVINLASLSFPSCSASLAKAQPRSTSLPANC